jgi:hypothetical protein
MAAAADISTPLVHTSTATARPHTNSIVTDAATSGSATAASQAPIASDATRENTALETPADAEATVENPARRSAALDPAAMNGHPLACAGCDKGRGAAPGCAGADGGASPDCAGGDACAPLDGCAGADACAALDGCAGADAGAALDCAAAFDATRDIPALTFAAADDAARDRPAIAALTLELAARAMSPAEVFRVNDISDERGRACRWPIFSAPRK